jgi:transposase
MSLEQEAAALRRENQELRALVKRLQARNAQLESQLAKATKNSGNSSKPPSSDIVKPPKPGRSKSRRSIGGQPGHPRHERTAFPPDQVDERVFHLVEECSDCGSRDLETLAEPVQVLQQVELKPKPIKVTEHCVNASRCRNCRRIHSGQLPTAIARTGMIGPRMMGMLLLMKGAMRTSHSGMAEFLDSVLGFRVSRGYLAKVMVRGTQALESPVESLRSLLPKQAVLNVD